MHVCSVCYEYCSCGGDSATPVAIEPADCTCCIGIEARPAAPGEDPGDIVGHCEHGIGLEEDCGACLAEDQDTEIAIAE